MSDSKTYAVNIPMYPLQIIISFDTDFELFRERVLRQLKNLEPEELDDFEEFFQDMKDKGKTKRTTTGDVISVFGGGNHGLIAHEVFHAATLYMDSLGGKLVHGSEESYAYLIQYLTDAVYDIIKK